MTDLRNMSETQMVEYGTRMRKERDEALRTLRDCWGLLKDDSVSDRVLLARVTNRIAAALTPTGIISVPEETT